MGIATWFAATLRHYPEIAIFLTLAIGYYFGKFTFRGIGLGSVTATLLAGVLIGQLGITISPPLKALVFLMFLFAVGYGVGPQFIRGIAKDGVPQALFAVVQCVLCLLGVVVIVKLAGYDLGYAAGLYSGSQTISAAMGLSTDAINRLGLSAEEAKKMLDSMPVAYAVSYMFGTMGSAIIIALVGPALLRINLRSACRDYEERFGGGGQKELGGANSAWHRWELRAFRVPAGSRVDGLRAIEAEALIPNQRLFIQRLRRNGAIEEANADTILQEGDIVAVAGAREVLLGVINERAKLMAVSGGRPMPVSAEPMMEADDPELLSVPVEGIDVYVTSKEVDGKTLAELAVLPAARGVFIRKITRGAVATSIPILPNTKIFRGDIVTLVGRTQDTATATKLLGVPDRATDVADVAFIGAGISVGALIGALVWKVAGVPITLSTAGGALISGLICGWLRSVHPTFGRIPTSTVWFMNSVGLNIFIAIVGISAGPGFVNGLKTQGIGLFLWGALATTVPLVLGMFIGKYLFRFHDALLLGIVSGARTTTASLGLVCDRAESQIPALGYTVTYAVGNTFLTIWGMVLIMLLAR
ncbi:MAG TPA: aspartate-alanine antiporter [Candidatus Angelobacter sp.]|jgi:putative transport protein|nr:aspartate-alanine antiporter [Candidatus Angelobacter sp.]